MVVTFGYITKLIPKKTPTINKLTCNLLINYCNLFVFYNFSFSSYKLHLIFSSLMLIIIHHQVCNININHEKTHKHTHKQDVGFSTKSSNFCDVINTLFYSLGVDLLYCSDPKKRKSKLKYYIMDGFSIFNFHKNKGNFCF